MKHTHTRPASHAARGASFLVALVASVGLLGCGDSTPGAASPSASEFERVAVDRKLTSTPWRLDSYRPQVGADALTMGLVSLQVQKLEVRFDGQWMRAVSPTVRFEAPYTIREAGAGSFTLETRHQGLVYMSRCTFSSDGMHIQFQAQTSPWQGEGSISRVR